MIKAFVFGKLLPFHKGHEAMINFALNNCDFLIVLICCSDKENIDHSVRKSWIKEAFAHKENVEVRTFNYSETELPNTSESLISISKIWAEVFRKQLPDCSLLITSEEYGNFVAGFMNIRHIAFDVSKKLFPVSSTAIRNDLLANWRFLPNSVKPYFVIKVVLLGTESTGKTTLTEDLSRHFNCSKVLETARNFIPTSNLFSINDLQLVAIKHAEQVNKAVLENSPLVIIDTDIHITKSYCRFIFKRELEVSDEIYNSNKADIYLYLNNDVDHFQDGTRLSKTERNLLDISHRQTLIDNNIKVVEVKGNWNDRFKKAEDEIHKIIKTKWQDYCL